MIASLRVGYVKGQNFKFQIPRLHEILSLHKIQWLREISNSMLRTLKFKAAAAKFQGAKWCELPQNSIELCGVRGQTSAMILIETPVLAAIA